MWTVAAGVLGERSEVEDVVQEACGVALGKLPEFQPGTSFAAWMAQIVRYVALNHLRSRQRSAARDVSELDLAWETPAAGTDPPVDLADDRGAFDDLTLRALRELAPVARACLLLRVVQELEYREIAALLGIPEGTAMSHVHRSRENLRRRLSNERGGLP